MSNYRIGQSGGAENVVLNTNQIPSHSHNTQQPVNTNNGTASDPEDNVPAAHAGGFLGNSDAAMLGNNTGNTGGTQQHTNLQPYLTVNWCVALVGVYPSRN